MTLRNGVPIREPMRRHKNTSWKILVIANFSSPVHSICVSVARTPPRTPHRRIQPKILKKCKRISLKFLKQIRRLGCSVLCKNLSISQKSTKQIRLLAAPPRHRICFKNFQGNSPPFFAKYASLDEGSLERFKVYVMNGSLVQWGGGGKKHAAKSMRGLPGVAEIPANIKKESMNLGI